MEAAKMKSNTGKMKSRKMKSNTGKMEAAKMESAKMEAAKMESAKIPGRWKQRSSEDGGRTEEQLSIVVPYWEEGIRKRWNRVYPTSTKAGKQTDNFPYK